MHKVETGIDYALVISTCAGLWRYIIGDTVRFLSTDTYEIVITGRISHYLSICGEHLSVSNMQDALFNAAEELKINITEFTVYGEKVGNEVIHNWYIAVSQIVVPEDVSKALDTSLCMLNDDYAAVRKRTLNAPKICIVPEHKFSEFLTYKIRRSGQTKFPRVLNSQQHENWISFIADSN